VRAGAQAQGASGGRPPALPLPLRPRGDRRGLEESRRRGGASRSRSQQPAVVSGERAPGSWSAIAVDVVAVVASVIERSSPSRDRLPELRSMSPSASLPKSHKHIAEEQQEQQHAYELATYGYR
jgi:hypothetical protein